MYTNDIEMRLPAPTPKAWSAFGRRRDAAAVAGYLRIKACKYSRSGASLCEFMTTKEWSIYPAHWNQAEPLSQHAGCPFNLSSIESCSSEVGLGTVTRYFLPCRILEGKVQISHPKKRMFQNKSLDTYQNSKIAIAASPFI